MSKKTVLLIAVCVLYTYATSVRKNRSRIEESTKYPYPVLFRDHVYYKLSNRGKELFHAVDIHPACVERKGQCIPRARCTGSLMLYISRICYHRDLVCCYDNSIRFPEVAHNLYVPPVPDNTTRETYIEPPVLP